MATTTNIRLSIPDDELARLVLDHCSGLDGLDPTDLALGIMAGTFEVSVAGGYGGVTIIAIKAVES